MEDGQNLNAPGPEDNYMTKSLDQREHSRSYNDIMVRRMKNRERQRRYRAKKRLEAENKKSSVIHQSNFSQAELQPNGKTLSTFSQVEAQPNGNLSVGVNRIYCKRNWKKDARNAHKPKGHGDTLNCVIGPAVTITAESQAACISSETKIESPLEMKIPHENSADPINCATRKPILGRRDWKADARNKMN